MCANKAVRKDQLIHVLKGKEGLIATDIVNMYKYQDNTFERIAASHRLKYRGCYEILDYLQRSRKIVFKDDIDKSKFMLSNLALLEHEKSLADNTHHRKMFKYDDNKIEEVAKALTDEKRIMILKNNYKSLRQLARPAWSTSFDIKDVVNYYKEVIRLQVGESENIKQIEDRDLSKKQSVVIISKDAQELAAFALKQKEKYGLAIFNVDTVHDSIKTLVTNQKKFFFKSVNIFCTGFIDEHVINIIEYLYNNLETDDDKHKIQIYLKASGRLRNQTLFDIEDKYGDKFNFPDIKKIIKGLMKS